MTNSIMLIYRINIETEIISKCSFSIRPLNEVEIFEIDSKKPIVKIKKKAMNILKKFEESYDSLQEIAIANLGIINGRSNNTELAKKYFLELLALGKKNNKLKTIAKANNNLGVVSENTGKLGSALVYYQSSYELWKQLKDTLISQYRF